MFEGRNLILTPFTACKKINAWNKTRKKHMPEKRRQDLVKMGRGSYYNKENSWENF